MTGTLSVLGYTMLVVPPIALGVGLAHAYGVGVTVALGVLGGGLMLLGLMVLDKRDARAARHAGNKS
jgi:hypothetical protein